MEKHALWYSPKNLHFEKYKYQCIVSKNICFSAGELISSKTVIFVIEDICLFTGKHFDNKRVYWIFTCNDNFNLN